MDASSTSEPAVVSAVPVGPLVRQAISERHVSARLLERLVVVSSWDMGPYRGSLRNAGTTKPHWGPSSPRQARNGQLPARCQATSQIAAHHLRRPHADPATALLDSLEREPTVKRPSSPT
jgi:hypothetical protein